MNVVKFIAAVALLFPLVVVLSYFIAKAIMIAVYQVRDDKEKNNGK